MIKLTEDQIKIAIEKTWERTADYMLEYFFPRMIQVAGQELLPEGLVIATSLAVEDVFSDGYPPIVKQLTYMSIPNFFKNLDIGNDGEKAIAFFNEAVSKQNQERSTIDGKTISTRLSDSYTGGAFFFLLESIYTILFDIVILNPNSMPYVS